MVVRECQHPGTPGTLGDGVQMLVGHHFIDRLWREFDTLEQDPGILVRRERAGEPS